MPTMLPALLPIAVPVIREMVPAIPLVVAPVLIVILPLLPVWPLLVAPPSAVLHEAHTYVVSECECRARGWAGEPRG